MDVQEPRTPSHLDAPVVRPMLRAVLVCDIVESTALVEKLGDARAAAFMQRHDQLMLQAMKLCHGQLVDKADGVLALFERPIQALDFALRYQRGLYELGQAEGFQLKARTGIHVGDVMTWANHPRDVAAGAKPFEVEGLAKPVAARLITLALPGQILMSGMAQNLAQRAAGELGERAGRLRWLMHGRYRFKGVPAPMLVHEVGEPGIAPLRPPDSGPKGWREVPLWRRPPVLAAEAMLLVALAGAVLWSTFRSEPAIAFAERDWVVVADLQNRTGEIMFDDALDTALRVGLEQSQYVNLYSDLQVDRALQRMQRPGQPLDRQLATELALREGARAVILPTIAQVGGVIRVSLEVIDPKTGVTVYSESADGRGVESVLPSLDTALADVRGRLGETMAAVSADRVPLEQATTPNIEALRAFSLGTTARYKGQAGDAEALFREAVRLDPGFAMAWLRLAFLRYVEGDEAGTREYLAQAQAHRDRLTRRELLFMEGAEATLDDAPRAVERLRLLASLYPDDYRGRYNAAFFAHFDLLRSEQVAEVMAGTDVPQNPQRPSAVYMIAAAELAKGDAPAAIALFEKSRTLGMRGSLRELIDAHASLRQYDQARRVAGQQTAVGLPAQDLESRTFEASLPLDQGDWRGARSALVVLKVDGIEAGATAFALGKIDLMALSLRAYAPDAAFSADLHAWVEAEKVAFASSNAMNRREYIFRLLAGAWMAAHVGEVDYARTLLAVVADDPQTRVYPFNASMARVVEAEIALAEGRAPDAIARLAGDPGQGGDIYFSKAVLMRALVAAGDRKQASRVASWLAENRAVAFGEPTYTRGWQLANVAESNLALRAMARLAEPGSAEAAEASEAFANAWPGAGDSAEVARRDAAL
ncbi:putative peptide modification system cyclase [Arenimonas caeni]|uniref:Putative peptide modification system cyclase n=1 Tax=Arenimonas caeni TaxID=2058085 RepID=A0A2P6M716_9GAMM|nr:putative peptide modification system cyclase [Arenimonas caeni]